MNNPPNAHREQFGIAVFALGSIFHTICPASPASSKQFLT